MVEKMVEVDDLLSFADTIVKKAVARGADEAEAFVLSGTTVECQIQGGILTTREGVDEGLGVRLVIGKSVGFASVSSLDEKQTDEVISKALSLAKITPENPKFHQLPDPVKRGTRSGVFDETIMTVDSASLMEESAKIVQEATQTDKRVSYVYGFSGLDYGTFGVVNSRGVGSGDKSTGIGAGIYLKAENNGEAKLGYELIVSRKYRDFKGVGENLAKNVIGYLGSKPLESTFEGTVIFENKIVDELFSEFLGYSVSALAVQEKRSFFANKLGKQVASKDLTIHDDPQLHEGIKTTKCDHEGIDVLQKPIIKEGVLKNYLYTSYTAYIDNVESTGNAIRSGFQGLPRTAPINITIQGNKNLEEMISEVEKGVLIREYVMGLGHANIITGDFSIVAPTAFLIEKGEIKHSLNTITIAGNFFQTLKNIQAIGKDSILTQNGKIPSIAVKNLTISG